MSVAEPKRPPIPVLTNNRITTELTASKVPETAWEIYNQRAGIVDKERIKDWNDSLSVLLVFVSSDWNLLS